MSDLQNEHVELTEEEQAELDAELEEGFAEIENK
jgi:hypothetical protein